MVKRVKTSKNIPKKKVYPYQNLSLEDMPGEKWMPIENYEDYYLISNYGRVKSLEKTIEFYIPGRHWVRYTKPERMLKQGKLKYWNETIQEESYSLTVTFCVNQQMDTHQVHRLVSNAFISKVDFQEDGKYIAHKDGDNLNNHYSNLKLSSRSESLKKAYKKKRVISAFKKLDSKKLAQKRSIKQRKPVTQYDLNGKRIKSYDSIRDAEAATGVYHSNISLAARKENRKMGGYYWRYGKGPLKIKIPGK